MCDHVIHLSNFDEIISLYSGSFRINVINYTVKLMLNHLLKMALLVQSYQQIKMVKIMIIKLIINGSSFVIMFSSFNLLTLAIQVQSIGEPGMRHRLVVTYSSEIVTHHLSASFQPSSLTLIYEHPFNLVFPPYLHHQQD